MLIGKVGLNGNPFFAGCSMAVRGSVVVDSLFIVAPIVCGGEGDVGSVFCNAVLSVLSSHSSSLRKRELVAFL